MRTFLVVAALLLAACVDQAAPEEEISSEADGTFNVPVGASCSMDTPLCDSGFAICKEAVCRAQCFVVGRSNRCPAGSRVQIDYERATVNGQEQIVSQSCYCLPD